jgi:hypothetical protein
MGMVDALAMSLPTLFAPAGPHRLNPDPSSGHQARYCGEDATGMHQAFYDLEALSPKRTLFNACICPMHGSLTDKGWRLGQ